MTARSYSPHGILDPNPDYQICFGLYHATTAAKFFASYFFVLCLLISGINFLAFGFKHIGISIFCIVFTVYSLVVIYGVFLEKKVFLLPFLIIQGFLATALFIITTCFALFGAFTNVIYNHHRDSKPLRSLYGMHNLDPDNETTQAMVSSTVLFFLVFQVVLFSYSWWVMLKTYKCYKENDRTICPGYQKGIVASTSHEDI
ncbi:unnamed protein product [Auanema sp. JU1783]|nr:unnamed protein product [Auanema sp. JU1783]